MSPTTLSWIDYITHHTQIVKDKLICNKHVQISYVPNESLFANHQTELTQFLAKHKQIKHIELSNITFILPNLSYISSSEKEQ